MSRRKQTKPRQIKRSLGDLEEGDDRPPDDLSLSEDEGGASDQEDSAECDSSPSREPALNCEAPAGPGSPDTAGTPATPGREEEEETPPLSCKEEEEEAESYWDGPDELHLSDVGGVRRVLARRDLAPDATWGPYSGRSLSAPQREGQEEEVAGLTLTGTDTELWLKRLPVTSNHSEANCTIYSQGEELYCKVTKAVQAGDSLLAGLPEPTPTETHNAPVKEEEPEPPHPEIHLLPQQAGMAAILATAIINKDVFPCKACGIWYRSERNLQAHLQFYCASRKQSPPSPASPASPASPPPEHPEERVRPPPRCAKSCPSASASALETPARTRSGERPFLCLICLSAFSSKPSCERHLQVHTDARGGTCPACPACGFAPATPDVLHGHLLTRHTAYRPGARSEGASPGPGLPPLLLSAGLGEDCGVVLKCQVCGFPADTLALLQQHVQTHLKVMSPAPRQSPSSSASPDSAPLGADVSPAPPGVRVKEEPQSDAENEAPPPSRSPSPRAPPTAQVKAEPASATPGSSPEPQGGAAPPPQASEILAKMTEMVHVRLRQSHAPTTPVGPAPARPVHKGATCFECDITFNNVNNFYVHKRLYCSGRHQHGDTPAATPTAAAASQPKERAEPSPPALGLGPSPGAPAPRAASDVKPAEAKAEGAGLREASGSEGESGGRASEASEGSQSPGEGEGEDAGDPDATFCRACNIRFSRRENYAVHKRFYCAWRRPAPGNQRAPAGNGGFPPQPVRTRKRKKMYEIHAARGRALAGSAPAPEPALALAPPPGLGSAPSPRPEGDGPVDLRKRPRPQEPVGPPAPPAPVLSDYHKCTACSISFNSIENYLAHKAYYCPVPLQRPPLQPRALAPPRPGPSDRPDPPPARTRSPAHSPPTPGSKGSSPHSSPPSCPPLTCPYCPPGGTVAGDLVDHFRTAHGLVLTRLPCGPPPGSHSPGRSEAPPPQASPALKPRPDAANGSSAPSSPLLNGSPRLAPPTPPPAVSPVAEVTKEAGRNPPQDTPTLAHVPAHTSPKAAQVSPLLNGTSRFCRLCNIRFSSLSTFVAHKKYYCSSHSAEHVK